MTRKTVEACLGSMCVPAVRRALSSAGETSRIAFWERLRWLVADIRERSELRDAFEALPGGSFPRAGWSFWDWRACRCVLRQFRPECQGTVFRAERTNDRFHHMIFSVKSLWVMA